MPAWLLLGGLVAGCGSSDPDWPEYVPAMPRPGGPPPAAQRPWHGYFAGTVDIGGSKFGAEAMLTVDGQLRIYILGQHHDWSNPVGAIQVSADVDIHVDHAQGSGIVFGEACADPLSNRFCGDSAEIQIAIDRTNDHPMIGEILVTPDTGPEVWLVDMGYFGGIYPGAWYEYPASTYPAVGQFRETLAEFAAGGDVLVNVDGAGELFFQSASSGCIGVGEVAPHLDGQFSVYDVSLTIQNCMSENAYLNGEFEGLAVRTPQDPWDYGAMWMRMWVSTSPGTPGQAALTFWLSPH